MHYHMSVAILGIQFYTNFHTNRTKPVATDCRPMTILDPPELLLKEGSGRWALLGKKSLSPKFLASKKVDSYANFHTLWTKTLNIRPFSI